MLLVACFCLSLVTTVAHHQPNLIFWSLSALFTAAATLGVSLALNLPLRMLGGKLAKLGVALAGWPGLLAGKGCKAALLLDRLNKRRDEGLTTPKQIRCLEKYGFQHVGTWSFEAARHMIDRIAAQGWRGVPKGVNPRTYTPAAEPPAADSPFDFG